MVTFVVQPLSVQGHSIVFTGMDGFLACGAIIFPLSPSGGSTRLALAEIYDLMGGIVLIVKWKGTRIHPNNVDGIEQSVKSKLYKKPAVNLGLELSWKDSVQVAIHQQRCVEDMIITYGEEISNTWHSGRYAGQKPPNIQMPQGYKVDKVAAGPGDMGINIRPIIGSLLWVQRGTHPEIWTGVSMVSMLSTQIERPSLKHYNMGLRIIDFLRNFPRAGIRFVPIADSPTIEIYVDAEFAGQPKECSKFRSRGGYGIFMKGVLIYWHCGKQSRTSTSIFDAVLNIADVWTKCLGALPFFYCITRFMCLDVEAEFHHERGFCECSVIPGVKSEYQDARTETIQKCIKHQKKVESIVKGEID
jgi:hypothetical protein